MLKACPDKQWQLLFALSRYGGLRCPSEHLALRWGDVDWDAAGSLYARQRRNITKARASASCRCCPSCGRTCKPCCDELLADFDPKAKRLSEQPVITRYRDSNANLRTQLLRIIPRRRLKPWPKLFQNLRASRATELAGRAPGACRGGLDGPQHEDCRQALLAGDRCRLRPGTAHCKCAAVTNGNGRIGRQRTEAES